MPFRDAHGFTESSGTARTKNPHPGSRPKGGKTCPGSRRLGPRFGLVPGCHQVAAAHNARFPGTFWWRGGGSAIPGNFSGWGETPSGSPLFAVVSQQSVCKHPAFSWHLVVGTPYDRLWGSCVCEYIDDAYIILTQTRDVCNLYKTIYESAICTWMCMVF